MTLLSRLLTPKPRTIERDVVAVTLADGRSVEVQRVRDPRARRLRLSVDERGARLTLPVRASLVSGARFLHEHRDWLATQLGNHNDDLPPLLRDQTAALPLRGEMLPLRWQDGRFARLQRDGDGLVLQLTARSGSAATHRAIRDFYETEARADIARWLPAYLPGLPRAPSQIRLKTMSSQWGSLAPNGALALDLSLVLAAPAAFEYVLVHELCHLIHADHSPAFWREVSARCPAWPTQRDYFHAEGRTLKRAMRRLLSG
ncbi:MAG: M48 family metallopeptidase [Luteimonas sp.]